MLPFITLTTFNIPVLGSGVPQGSVLGPIFYLFYRADLPTSNSITTGTFADDTAILAAHEDPTVATQILQAELDNISISLGNYRIRANESMSIIVTFTLKKFKCPPVKLNYLEVCQISRSTHR